MKRRRARHADARGVDQLPAAARQSRPAARSVPARSRRLACPIRSVPPRARPRLVKHRRTSSRRNRARPQRTPVRPTLRRSRTSRQLAKCSRTSRPRPDRAERNSLPFKRSDNRRLRPKATIHRPPTRICRPGSPTRAILRHRASRPTILNARSIEERDAEPRFGGAHFAPRYSGALQIPGRSIASVRSTAAEPNLSVARRPFE